MLQPLLQESKLALSFTMAHLVFKFMAAGLIRWIVEWRSGEPRVLLGWKEYCKRVAICGNCFIPLTACRKLADVLSFIWQKPDCIDKV
jgi:hypothetical protein